MVKSTRDLHGSVPDQCKIVLLILDMFSDFCFPQGLTAARCAARVAPRIAALKSRCRLAGIPSIYVNDSVGRWQSNVDALLKRCLAAQSRGRKIAELLKPGAEDYFVLKAKHSGFFATPLHTLLSYFGCEHLILTGGTAQQCVLQTACDAYVRDYALSIPFDCVISLSAPEQRFARYYFKNVLKADLARSPQINLRAREILE